MNTQFMTEAFCAVGCGLGRQHLAGLDYTVHAESAIVLVESYADGEITWSELLAALSVWEATARYLPRRTQA